MRSLFRIATLFAFTIAVILPGHPLLGGQKGNASGGKRLASVDGVAITETQARMEGAADLDSLELQMMRAKAAHAQSEHQILERALNRLVEEKLVRAEAAKRGITKEELLAEEIQKNVAEPTGEEVDAFYEANKQRIKKSKEEVASQIGQYLKQQREKDAREAFLERLEDEHNVVRSFEPLRFDVNASGRPSLGPPSAPVVLVEFSDFQCPYCKSSSATLKEVLKQYGDKVRLVFRQFPLSNIHPNAQRAAEASLCASAQNHFWEMHDLLFRSQNSLKEEDLKNKADQLGLDSKAFNACLASTRYGALVHEDIRAGSAAGVDGTPALFINGRFLNGARPYEEIAAVIDEELKIKK
jgi:predicted DsbA family dithiol-disulfide isomerase